MALRILASKRAVSSSKPTFASASGKGAFKVAVIGASGGIGQPLSLLLKLDPRVSQLNLYDVSPVTPGVAADLSHIPTPAQVKGYTKPEDLALALKGVDIVVVPAGVPRKPGMKREDLFNVNAGIVKNIAENVAKSAPNAALLIISNPVNSTVPIAAETLKKAGAYNPKKLFGVTTLDVIRAQTFVGELMNSSVRVPVIGGHAGITILPLLSQVKYSFTNEQRDKLIHRIMFGGDEVVQAKGGAGSATLSMAQAGYQFATTVMRGLSGESNVRDYSFVESNLVKDVAFFSSEITVGRDGLQEIHPFQKLLNDHENQLLQKAIPELQASIKQGIEFARK